MVVDESGFGVLGAIEGSTQTDALRLGTLTFVLIVAIVGLFAFVLLIALARRRRRLEALKAESIRKRRIEDAWKAAGQRAATPSAESLDNDRMDLEDTNFPGMDGPNIDEQR